MRANQLPLLMAGRLLLSVWLSASVALTGGTVFAQGPCTNDPDCVDANPCTNDICNAGTCENLPVTNGSPCTDGNVCNGHETCQSAQCTSGTPLDCSDDDPCTDPACDPESGCFSTFNTAPCDDGIFCTVGERCSAGTCTGGVPLDCSVEDDFCNVGVCNEEAAACEPQPTNEGGECFSGADCVESETCSGGVCGGGTPMDPEDCFSSRVVVTNREDDTVSVLRASDFTLEATVVTGTLPVGIAIHPEASTAYITNNVDDSVSVISLDELALIATIPVGTGPMGAAATPDGEFLYVANNVDDSISVISTAVNAVTETIELDPLLTLPPFGPFGVTVTPGGDFVYVTNNKSDSVTVIRANGNVVIGEFGVGNRPQGIAASPQGLFVYVAQTGDDNVGVMRVIDNALIGLIAVGAEPTSVTFTPDGEFAYVGNSLSNTVSKIRTAGIPVVTATLPVGDFPAGLAVTENGKSLCVANTGSNTVSFISVATNNVESEVGVGTAPFGVAVRPQSVLSVAGSAAPTPVQPGSQLTFTLTYSNSGMKSADNVVMSGSIPAITTFLSATGNGALGVGEVRWQLGQLVGGASGTESFVVTVDNPVAPGTELTSLVSLVDDQAVTARALVSATVESSPQYSLAKVDSSDPVSAGGQLMYTITYANNAGADADGQGVTTTEIYDPNVSFVSAVPPPVTGTDNQWLVGSLPVGTSGTITVTVAVESPLPNGTIIQNEARLSDSLGNEVIATQNTVVQSSPLLAIGLSDNQDPAAPGTQVSYVINYSNSGNENASDVVIRTTYDSNVVFISATPSPDPATTDTWTIGDLDIGASGVIVATVQLAGVLPNGTILTTQAQITDGGGSSATATENTTVSSAPLLNLTISDDPDPIATGSTLTYTITYANSGTDTALGASVLVTYDPGTTFLAAVPSPAVGNNQWNLGDLPMGGSGTISVSVQVDAALGSIVTGQAVISDTVGNSSSASENTTVQITRVLTLTMSDSVDPVAAGDILTYTVRYSNQGNDPATNTTVTVAYDSNLTFVSAVPPPDSGTDQQWSVGAVNDGSTGDILVSVLVNSPLPDGTIIATQAAVAADGGVFATASEDTTVESEPAVAISKIDASDPTTPGADLTYTIAYSNPGNDLANGVVITEAYDPIVSFVGGVPPPDPGTNNTWTVGDLDGGESGTIDVTVAVPTVPNGTVLTNQVGISDAQNRSATATENTTVRSAIFDLGLADSADPVTTLALVEFTLRYQNSTGLLQTEVVLSAVYDARFIVEEATPAADSGTDDTWTLGTLTPGQSGTIVVRGFFTPEEGSAPTITTTAQISNLNGTAFASEATTVDSALNLTRPRIRMRSSTRKDSWSVRGGFTPSGQLMLDGEEISVSLSSPEDVQHIIPLLVPQLERAVGGQWRFLGDLPGNGRVRLRMRQKRSGQWRIAARAKGTNILPEFSLERAFRAIVRVGTTAFVSNIGELRQSANGIKRRYP